MKSNLHDPLNSWRAINHLYDYIQEPEPFILFDFFCQKKFINLNYYSNDQFVTFWAYCSRFGNASSMGSTSSASRPEDMKVINFIKNVYKENNNKYIFDVNYYSSTL